MVEVEGSNPPLPTISDGEAYKGSAAASQPKLRGYSSVGRAMRSQRIGHGFESHYLHHLKARYAQHIVLFCFFAFLYIVVKLVGKKQKVSSIFELFSFRY